MKLVGYARVSTDGQSLDTQIAELTAAGASQIFAEKVTGARSDRTELMKAIHALNAGDVFLVVRLDRLARSTRDLLNLLATVASAEAGFRSLRDVWADTTTPHGRLIVTVLAGLAEFERELILSRTSEGRDRARSRGVKMGRKTKLTPFQIQEARERKASGDGVTEIAKSFGVSHSTVSRLLSAR